VREAARVGDAEASRAHPSRRRSTADDLLLLFAFVFIRARVPQLCAHIAIMSEFCDERRRAMVEGYYITTAEVALQVIVALAAKPPPEPAPPVERPASACDSEG
jgi:hypothetical protein